MRAAQLLRQQRLTWCSGPQKPGWNSATWPTTTPRWAWPDTTDAGHDQHENLRAGCDCRDRLSDTGVERAQPAGIGGPARRAGPQRILEPGGKYLSACLQREVAARDANGGEGRIRAARFPARKGIQEFDFDHARGLKRDLIAHLATVDFVAAKENVIFLGPPGTGKPTWRSAAAKPGTGWCLPPPANGSTR